MFIIDFLPSLVKIMFRPFINEQKNLTIKCLTGFNVLKPVKYFLTLLSDVHKL